MIELYLPVDTNSGVTYTIDTQFHDASPAEDGVYTKARYTLIDLTSTGPAVNAVAAWNGTLRFIAEPALPDDVDPLDSTFSATGDFILQLRTADAYQTTTALANEATDAFAPLLPTYLAYMDVPVSSAWLTGPLWAELQDELATYEDQTDGLRAFLRGDAAVNVEGGFQLSALLDGAGSTTLKLMAGNCYGAATGTGLSPNPLDDPSFAHFPVDLIYQIGSDRDLLADGEGEHQLLAVLTSGEETTTMVVIPDDYLPEEGLSIGDCFPYGLIGEGWTQATYSLWTEGGERFLTTMPNDGRFHASVTETTGAADYDPEGSGSAAPAAVLSFSETVPASVIYGAPPAAVMDGRALIIQSSQPIFDVEWIRAWMVGHRDYYNQNNTTRTEYYLRYWKRNPEIPWAVMAHLVSRNAGYQMTDLIRNTMVLAGEEAVDAPSTDPTALAVDVFMEELFAYLEAANYLIFRDVVPGLMAYEWSKRLYSTGDHHADILGMLTDATFAVDPRMQQAWLDFFPTAAAAGWWVGASHWDIVRTAEIQDLNLTLVVNEQNQIEKRLVNPVSTQYFGSATHTLLDIALAAASFFEATGLIVPLADDAEGVTSEIMYYTVSDFSSLDSRIHTGRALFKGIFLSEEERLNRFVNWVNADSHSSHYGTRVQYDPWNYTMNWDASSYVGRYKYSPPIIDYESVAGVWPASPGNDPDYAFTNSVPLELPPWSSECTESQIVAWISDVSSETDTFVSSPFGDNHTRSLDEVPF